jgi:hypothetical protein
MSDLQHHRVEVAAKFETIYARLPVRQQTKQVIFLCDFGGAARI